MKKIDLFTSFIKNPRETSYEGKDSDEEVKILVRQSLLTTVSWIFISILLILIPIFLTPYMSALKYNGNEVFDSSFLFCFSLFWYVFMFGYMFQSFLNWYFEVLLITNKKVVDIDRGCTNISETPLRNIQDVTSTMTSIWGQVLNIGSIRIQTAAEREEFEFKNVDNPSVVRDTVSDLVLRKNEDGNTI